MPSLVDFVFIGLSALAFRSWADRSTRCPTYRGDETRCSPWLSVLLKAISNRDQCWLIPLCAEEDNPHWKFVNESSRHRDGWIAGHCSRLRWISNGGVSEHRVNYKGRSPCRGQQRV